MKSWLLQHGKALHWALQRLMATPLNTLLSWLAIGILLAMPASAQMLLGNLGQWLSGQTQGAGPGAGSTAPRISLFVKLDADPGTVAILARRLNDHPEIRQTRFIPREDTYTRMQADPKLRDVLAALPGNPYPDTFIITPKDETPQAVERLRDDLARDANIEQAQLDTAWLRRLDALMRLARTSVTVLGVLLGTGLIAIIFTTLRFQILVQRAEIELCRLLGATEGYIRRPFYYLGALQGAAGGALALLIVLGVTLILRKPINQLASLYDIALVLQPLPWRDSLLLLGGAALLGWLGAALSLGRYLGAAGAAGSVAE